MKTAQIKLAVLWNETHEERIVFSLAELLHELNRNRSDDWIPYTKRTGFKALTEGITEFTDYSIIQFC